MISKLLYALERAIAHIKEHPQIFFVLILLIVFPLLFLYTGQQFLDVGRANQDRLQKDRVGLLHDSFASLIAVAGAESEIVKTELEELSTLNPDIVDYAVSKAAGSDIVTILSKENEKIGTKAEGAEADFYKNAALRSDESLIFETNEDGRVWYAYRGIQGADGATYFIYTKLSLKTIDSLFKSREQAAYFSLIFVYCFIIALAYWHIKLTDYRYLYISAKKANETKDLFTNMIAHELRAPLTAIKGYASLVREKITDIDQKTYVSRIEESSERLLAIVNDLLDVARIQSGKLAVTFEEVDVSEVISSVISELQVSATDKNITLKKSLSGTFSKAKVDKKRLHQVLTNLVSNAIKYNKEGGNIELSAEEKSAYVEIRVKDTGMGISSEDQQKLFAPFFRVKSDDVSKITGTGLGMWITKQFVELMGGKIGVESIKGVGTHIVISLEKAKLM